MKGTMQTRAKGRGWRWAQKRPSQEAVPARRRYGQ